MIVSLATVVAYLAATGSAARHIRAPEVNGTAAGNGTGYPMASGTVVSASGYLYPTGQPAGTGNAYPMGTGSPTSAQEGTHPEDPNPVPEAAPAPFQNATQPNAGSPARAAVNPGPSGALSSGTSSTGTQSTGNQSNGSLPNGSQNTPTPSPQPQATGNTVTVHPDGQCQLGLRGNAPNSYQISDGFPKFTTIQRPTFPGAEAMNGAGGWNVFWSMPKPNPGCRWQIMLPFRQASSTPGFPGGNEIVNVGRAGCYFGQIPTDSDVLLSSCCGSDDCQKAALNSTSLLSTPQRREIEQREARLQDRANTELAADIQRAAHAALNGGTGASTAFSTRHEAKRSGGSGAAKARAHLNSRYYYDPPPPQAPPKDCQVVKPGQPYSRAGRQVVVSSSQACASSPCSVALQYQISYSTTATSSTTQTLTNTIGASVGVTAGVDFIGKAEVTTTLSTEFSKAVATATGHDVMSGNSSTVTQTISLALGNRGVVTFTPVYQCITGPLDCGNGVSSPIDFCQPDLSGPNGSPAGDYYPLISD